MKRGLVLFPLLLACGSSPPPDKPTATPVASAKTEEKKPEEKKPDEKKTEETMTTFADDLAFMAQHGKIVTLTGEGDAKVALSAEWQGRVMTSGVGEKGRSLGWINRSFIEGKKTGTQFDNFGGEDRFWLGPEGGQYGLYFPPGAKYEFDLWQTPHEMQEGAWAVKSQDAGHVTLEKTMKVTNWSKVDFEVKVLRTVRLLGKADAKKHLGIDASAPLVAYESDNEISNAGKTKWTKEKGLVSIWILAMYAPVPDTRVVVPFDTKSTAMPIVNDAYFGKVPADRLLVKPDAGVLFFKCDGKHRSKIGLGPKRAKNVLGSYSAQAKLLTIVHYDKAPAGAPYVNSMWEQQKEPYGGDVVNSYNDGSPGPGKPPLGGFYEIETSSPGLELAPGAKGKHAHRTFHFVGEPSVLEPIAKQVLGVGLSEISSSLP
jgi:hypothetical protein